MFIYRLPLVSFSTKLGVQYVGVDAVVLPHALDVHPPDASKVGAGGISHRGKLHHLRHLLFVCVASHRTPFVCARTSGSRANMMHSTLWLVSCYTSQMFSHAFMHSFIHSITLMYHMSFLVVSPRSNTRTHPKQKARVTSMLHGRYYGVNSPTFYTSPKDGSTARSDGKHHGSLSSMHRPLLVVCFGPFLLLLRLTHAALPGRNIQHFIAGQ